MDDNKQVNDNKPEVEVINDVPGFPTTATTDSRSANRSRFRVTEDQPKEVGAKKTVRLVNYEQHDGRYIVYDPANKKDAWLVEAQYVVEQKGDQEIAVAILDRSIRPYNWQEEIRKVMATLDDLNFAMWYSGHVEKDDVNVKEILAALFKFGLLPITE